MRHSRAPVPRPTSQGTEPCVSHNKMITVAAVGSGCLIQREKEGAISCTSLSRQVLPPDRTENRWRGYHRRRERPEMYNLRRCSEPILHSRSVALFDVFESVCQLSVQCDPKKPSQCQNNLLNVCGAGCNQNQIQATSSSVQVSFCQVLLSGTQPLRPRPPF